MAVVKKMVFSCVRVGEICVNYFYIWKLFSILSCYNNVLAVMRLCWKNKRFLQCAEWYYISWQYEI